MPSAPRHSSLKPTAYLELLKFSRVTDPGTVTDDRELLLDAINSLPGSPRSCNPFIPLVYNRALRTGLFADLKPGAQSFIREHALLLAGQEAANRRWLETAVEAFREFDIPVILLKGAAFAGDLYSIETPRPGSDLDLLVKARDFAKACDVLLRTMKPVRQSASRSVMQQTLFEREFAPRGRTFPVVELHRGLTNPHIFRIDEESLWSSSRPHASFGDEKVRVLSREHSLLHLAVHAFRDMDFCNHNVLDTHEIICQWGFSQDLLLRGASDWGARGVLFHLLENARTVMETPLDSEFISELKPARLRLSAQRALLRLPVFRTAIKHPGYRLAQLASQLAFPDRLRSALRFQLHYAVTRTRDLLPSGFASAA